MDPDPSPRRKMKFAPKAPPRRRNPKPAVTIPVKDAEDDDDDDIQLLRRFSRQTRQEPRVEKKPAEEVLFSNGVASTDHDQSERASSSRQNETKDDQMQPVSTAGTGVGDGSENSTIAATEKKKKEYREPWDYDDSYYPTTLPLRRPYSGNPGILNKAEFEEAPKHNEDDDLPPAIELGLVDQDDTPQLLFFKFPSTLPLGALTRRETNDQSKAPEKSLKGKGIAGLDLNSSVSGAKGKEVCSVEELPKGYMGKMLVYKSGAVKLKLGDVLFDVSAGIDCNCPQTAMGIDTMTGDCCDLGDVTKRAVVVPNLDHLDASDD